MLVTLAVPYRDVRVGDLTFSLAPTDVPALAEAQFVLPTGTVTLIILGSSHRVHVEGVVNVCETVACLEGSPKLPSSYEEDSYRFAATIESLERIAFETLVTRLIRQAKRDEHTILGQFPGIPQALTMVRVDGDGAGWQTWHTYPREGEVVRTRSSLR